MYFICLFAFQMESECAQFVAERAERTRLLHERHERELEHFDNESARLGFRLDYSFISIRNEYVALWLAEMQSTGSSYRA